MKNIIYTRNIKGQYTGAVHKEGRAVVKALVAIAILTAVVHALFTSTKPTEAKADVRDEVATSTQYAFNPCDLEDVVCAGEAQPATASAYSAREQETDSSPCIAADGSDICKRNRAHETICASNDYKLGTVLETSLGFDCTVSDRMNRRYTGQHRIDIFYGHDTKAALAFGTKSITVKVKN